jgi:hypothetical protein
MGGGVKVTVGCGVELGVGLGVIVGVSVETGVNVAGGVLVGRGVGVMDIVCAEQATRMIMENRKRTNDKLRMLECFFVVIVYLLL